MQNETNPSGTMLPETALVGLPVDLRQHVEGLWQDFCVADAVAAGLLAQDEALLQSLCKVWACSEFVARACVRYPGMLSGLVRGGYLQADSEEARCRLRLDALLENVSDDNTLGIELRRFRREEMVRIAWCDIAGWAGLDETLRDLSTLAIACVEAALSRLHDWQSAELGMPIGEQSSQPQSLVVLGMGKLGAGELNYSSDIDLIFAYAEEGQTEGGRYALSNSEYFVRLGRRLINVLNQKTAEGFVFRVDMRLRPFGDAGPLAISFAAMENYYQVHGREWERYAMVKAAVIAGDQDAGAELMEILRPFVYRRYLDYGAFESLREMKQMIASEVQRKGMQDNIKLGPGGIREVEFIGQAYQLIRGGRDRGLQIRPIQKVLKLLAEMEYLPEYVVVGLQSAYVFLRQAENRLQAMHDQQTHSLPKNEIDRQRLALAMGHHDWQVFEPELRKRMAMVHDAFDQVFVAPQREQAAEQGSEFDALWAGTMTEEAAAGLLHKNNYQDSDEVRRLLQRLREGSAFRSLSSRGRERLDRLMPLLLGAVAAADEPELVLARVINLIEAIVRRTAYLALLVENPIALSQLVKLFAASPWIAKHLARYPVLLDELLDARSLYAPLNRAALEAELNLALEQVGDDLEQQMEALRHFKQANVLRVAAADVMGAFPLMVVSDHLTEIAEVVLAQVVRIAYLHLVKKHGRPQCKGQDGELHEPGFLVVAYGKLGGIELGYGSDLDLVFLQGNYASGGQTDGASPTDNMVFFARLGQRMIHIMTALTPAGVLYEVDSRLRPSGDAGMLVADMNAFAVYQENDAWTWEHQALVRARVVVGSAVLTQRFDIIRAKVLGCERDPQQLQADVFEMRQKMREVLSKANTGWFDLKQDPGGIADIEFMVQYLVLRWANQYPSLLKWTDNIRLLETLAAEGLLADADAQLLADAYRAYRAAVHRLALQESEVVVEHAQFADWRQGVTRIWRDLLETVE